ncbi:MAG: hypothetical protein JWO77_1063 [Ilumatobacteraceae bacterium]|nr:hypothetical protein [Ilumatobacteraceae bacterium]
MLRTRRPLAILGSAAAAVALVLVSCGVEAGDSAATTPSTATTATTAPAKDLTPEQQQLADTMTEAYTGLGFTDEEATCLSQGIAGTLGPGAATPDLTAMMDVLNQCDIPMDRLMDIQGDMGDGTPEGAMRESLAAGFKANGMTQEEADCVAGAFIDEYGVDVNAMMDPDKMVPLADQCGVDVASIRPGG